MCTAACGLPVGLFLTGPLQAQLVTVLPLTAPWRYTTNNISSIFYHLRSVESTFATCETLNNYF